ncbi:hypothetical protein [Autumnicola musiva]|uniref:SGNH/GDSL hydrolase family protein n=1 Tax=Autumnicola musiva TaxID=3075589 RepID=A0ABU3D7E6_9FLAO|nr:hypothetical protein [Zunongwangia sp. F117]MDT0677461.1 hypothetical protein [Zunongwangia sp. F117]
MALKYNRILIVAASMATPRAEVKYINTWIYKLVNNYPDLHIIDKSKRGLSSRALIRESLLEDYDPNLVIMQLGLSDCAPRYLQENALSTKIINNLPGSLKKTAYYFVKKYKSRRMKNANVNLEAFKKNFENYIIRAEKKSIDIICLLISPVGESFKIKNPEIQKAIEAYNNVLVSLDGKYSHFTTVECFTEKTISEYLLADGHHVNESAHNIFLNKIAPFLS